MADDTRLSLVGFGLLAGITLGWGFTWPVLKIALAEIPPWTFRGLTCGASGVGLLLLARAFRLSLVVPAGERWPLAACALFNVTGWHVLNAHGVSLLDSGRAVILAYTMPLWATLFAVFLLEERITPRRSLALLLGIAGMTVLVAGDFEAAVGAPAGALFMVGAAVSWAAGTVLIKRVSWTVPTIVLVAWQLVLGSLPMLPVALLVEEAGFAGLSPGALLAAAYVVFVSLMFASAAWIRLVRLLPATVASISIFLVPVVGVLAGMVVLDERPALSEFAALLLVVSGIGLVLFGPAAKEVQPEFPD